MRCHYALLFSDFMQVPADEWQSKLEVGVKETKKLEDQYIVKCQSLRVSILCFSLFGQTQKKGKMVCTISLIITGLA